jgi:DNA-binding response OmpR family regulator
VDAERSTRPVRVLIVDDEPALVEVLQEVLTRAPCYVRTASTGAEALEVALAFRPDVILLDIALSDLSGNEVLAELRERGVHVPVIALAPRLDPVGPGFFEALVKPMDLVTVARVVAAAVRGRNA